MAWCTSENSQFKKKAGSFRLGSVVMNPTRIHEDASLIPGLAQWVKDPAMPMSCGVGRRCSSDPKVPWLWWRPAAAAPIQPLA